jgi:ERCC4-type nuclease
MKIIIDSREQAPLTFQKLESERGTLQSGDYSVQGLEHLFAVERKSIQDLVASVTRERDRFERELHRLRGFRFKRVLIVGNESQIINRQYRGNANPKSILHSLYAFECRYDIPFIWGGGEGRCSQLVERWAFWFAREVSKSAERLSA